ncbi:hypothetical protein HZH66_003435 [Vespula vulgaris]|uniref:Uncharacterized protein n=1 Tax=Vespula vulgaris TaxID=7454 RepID=A0A836UYS5_VESVU|nr:hypothetical protein HZH66_003435 [Vespula vulgaris]
MTLVPETKNVAMIELWASEVFHNGDTGKLNLDISPISADICSTQECCSRTASDTIDDGDSAGAIAIHQWEWLLTKQELEEAMVNGTTETLLTILLRGSFKLDNNNSIAKHSVQQPSASQPASHPPNQPASQPDKAARCVTVSVLQYPLHLSPPA